MRITIQLYNYTSKWRGKNAIFSISKHYNYTKHWHKQSSTNWVNAYFSCAVYPANIMQVLSLCFVLPSCFSAFIVAVPTNTGWLYISIILLHFANAVPILPAGESDGSPMTTHQDWVSVQKMLASICIIDLSCHLCIGYSRNVDSVGMSTLAIVNCTYKWSTSIIQFIECWCVKIIIRESFISSNLVIAMNRLIK